MRTACRVLMAGVAVLGLIGLRAEGSTCDLTQVPYCTWVGNNDGFFAVGDTGSTITFQTLPNGSPSFGGASITPAFNYVLQGALFSPAFPNLFITGNAQLGYGLTAYTSNPIANNTITAQLTNPERGVGLWVGSFTTLRAFDVHDTLITSVTNASPNVGIFLGVRSNIPVARVIVDKGSNSNTIDDFTMIHIPVPEPATAALLLLAAPILFRHSRQFRRM